MPNTREKLIELLNDHVCLEGKDDCAEECSACLADHLIAHGVTVQEWISVKDRLPEMHMMQYEDIVEPAGYEECLASDSVLVYCQNSNGFYVAECSRSDENSQLYWIEAHSCISICPTHWMPLPQPPKDKNN